ncbi:hypothetical protein PROFUN_16186 [Planoprotostelium fungivorum]|uniref:Uncharacterized protein n=1 Tax=Planoprotostelium fungivorum TaxID=1890364 RepID=A0A2P6MS80_9EUKA|nr:hypothetical protein PROFUN_16186 [Planoprotostelium fungivorum]
MARQDRDRDKQFFVETDPKNARQDRDTNFYVSAGPYIQCMFIEKEHLGFLWFEIILYKQRLIELFGSYVFFGTLGGDFYKKLNSRSDLALILGVLKQYRSAEESDDPYTMHLWSQMDSIVVESLFSSIKKTYHLTESVPATPSAISTSQAESPAQRMPRRATATTNTAILTFNSSASLTPPTVSTWVMPPPVPPPFVTVVPCVATMLRGTEANWVLVVLSIVYVV